MDIPGTKKLMLLAARQYGVFTVAQAKATGLSRRALNYRTTLGTIRSLTPGIYIVGGAPETWNSAAMSAVLSSDDPAALSHGAAARLWGVNDFRDASVEVSTPRSHNVRRAFQSHRTLYFLREEITMRSGIPVTSFARTVIDLSGRGGLGGTARLLDEGLRRNLVTLESIRRLATDLPPAPGRKLSIVRKLLKERLPGYDPGDSVLEVRHRRWIVASGLPEPIAQFPIEIDGRRFYLDAAYPEYKVFIESDGYAFHSGATSFVNDRVRENLLVAAGWLPLRFTAKSSRGEVVGVVAQTLQLRTRRFGT